MYNSVVWYNFLGNGDIFNSKEFIRKMMQIIPAKEYYHASAKSPRILDDIDNLIPITLNNYCDNAKHFQIVDNNLYMNTWIGLDSKYVLPGIGCTIEKNLERYNWILHEIGINEQLDYSNIFNFIPQVSKISEESFQKIKLFLISHKNPILISNGDVWSDQAENFNFSPIIKRVCEEFSTTRFILTENANLFLPNITYTEDIFGGGYDLNEIGYLSTFCPIIIGRSSGPYVFSQNRGNIMNPQKKFLSFTRHSNASKFFYTVVAPCKLKWSPATDEETVFKKICEVINE